MSTRRSVRTLVAAGLAICLMLAGAASHYASSAPDGLDRVASDVGFSQAARQSAAGGSPLAGYDLEGVASDRLSVGLSGVVGVLVTGILALGLFTMLARRVRTAAPQERDVSHDALVP